VKQSIIQLDQLNLPYKRPVDFFAEMLKSDAHMTRVKDSLLFEKKKMDAAADQKKQRDIRKYSKQVHAARVQERAKQKRESIEAVDKWRKGNMFFLFRFFFLFFFL
jgi:rRNA-processing protein EBP2